METSVAEITPAKAAIYLKSNPQNRRINEGNVLFLSSQMRKGLWKLNGQSVVIAIDGTLIDGQHRLLAVIRSGVAMQTILCTGAEKEVMPTVDTGKPRNASDTFSINGIKSAASTSALSNALYKWSLSKFLVKGGMAWSHKAPNAKVLSIYEADKHDISWAIRKGATKSLKFMRNTECALAIYLCSKRHGKVAVDDFVRFITDGGDYAKSPTHLMPIWINRRNASDYKRERGEDCIIFLHCFSKWMDDEPISNIKAKSLMDNGGSFYDEYRLPSAALRACKA